MSDSLVSSVVRQAGDVADLRRQERPGAAITLTRTATLAIITAGTVITWQSATRSAGFVFGGATPTITIPTEGFYSFFFFGTVNTNQINFFTIVSGGNLFTVSTVRAPTTVATAMLYFATGDTLTVVVTPSANVTLSANVRVDIVQLTGVI